MESDQSVVGKCFLVKQGFQVYTAAPMVGGDRQVTQPAADTYITVTSGGWDEAVNEAPKSRNRILEHSPVSFCL